MPSPDPAFSDVEVPLVSSFLLFAKAGKEVWVEPKIDSREKTISYNIISGNNDEDRIARAKTGTKDGRGGNFRCIYSNSPISPKYIKEIGQKGRIGQTLIAIVAEGKNGRQYINPNDTHIEVALSSKLRRDAEVYRNTFLAGKIPAKLTGGTCYSYGINQWGKIFTDRQLVVLNTFLELIHEVRDTIYEDALAAGMSADGSLLRNGGNGAKAYSEAVSVYLAFILDRLVSFSSSICTWDASYGKMRNAFGRQAIPMTWDFAESNPFSSSTGSWISMKSWVQKAVSQFVISSRGHQEQIDAQTVKYPPSCVISTDPPYYDNICYADLSDYFYPWMKSSLGKVYPDLFGFLSTPKREELIAARHRHNNSGEAEKYFLEGMEKAIRNMALQSSANFPVTIFYAFKQAEIKVDGTSSKGWATFLQAVVNAGYSVVGTWPMRTEMAHRMIALGTNALASSVVLVCRKRDQDAPSITKSEFIRKLKRDLPLAIDMFKEAGITPADLPQSAIGPGIGIFSHSKSVLEPDDSAMTVTAALKLINSICDEYIDGIKGEFDTETRFAIRWFTKYGMQEGDYGTADKFAWTAGISVDDISRAGIVESSSGTVRLLAPGEVGAHPSPERDQDKTHWECLRKLVHLHGIGGASPDAAEAFRRLESRADTIRELAYVLYNIAVNNRGNPSEGTAYNALIADWSELGHQAIQHGQRLNFGKGESDNG